MVIMDNVPNDVQEFMIYYLKQKS